MFSICRGCFGLVVSLSVLASACTASIDQDLASAPDDVQVALSRYMQSHTFRNLDEVPVDQAECISGRLVGRLGRERLAVAGLGDPADTESFFLASIFWSDDIGSAFDRVVTGCRQHLGVRAAGATYALRLANAYVVPTEGQEFCLGEWLLSNGLDGDTAPRPADAAAIVATGDQSAIDDLLVMSDAVGSCFGLGGAALISYPGENSLRPASVDCLAQRASDLGFRALIEMATPLDGPDPASSDALIEYLANCMTDEEVATMVGVL